jgi:hypothetical protein
MCECARVCVYVCKREGWLITYSLQRTDVSAKFHQWNAWYCGLVPYTLRLHRLSKTQMSPSLH